jgi:hypothetical protein
MKTPILQVALHLRTAKWPVLAAALSWFIALALGSHVLWQQQTHSELINRVATLRGQLNTPSTTDLSPPVTLPPEQVLQSTLGEPEQLEEYLRTLFDIAGKQEINLRQGNYKTLHSAAGNYDVYTIDLPVSGPYRKIKTISEQMLLALPFSALEDIKFKRENAGDAALETQLRFALFLKPASALPDSKARPALKTENKAGKQDRGRS